VAGRYGQRLGGTDAAKQAGKSRGRRTWAARDGCDVEYHNLFCRGSHSTVSLLFWAKTAYLSSGEQMAYRGSCACRRFYSFPIIGAAAAWRGVNVGVGRGVGAARARGAGERRRPPQGRALFSRGAPRSNGCHHAVWRVPSLRMLRRLITSVIAPGAQRRPVCGKERAAARRQAYACCSQHAEVASKHWRAISLLVKSSARRYEDRRVSRHITAIAVRIVLLLADG